METLEVHELANLIPAMTDEEYEKLKEDIQENGQLDPIRTYEGKILDGRNRYRACTELGIPPVAEEYTGDDPAKLVISLNLVRRHLTNGQRIATAKAVLPYYKEDARRRQGEYAASAPRDEHGHVQPTSVQANQSRDEALHKRARDEAAQDVGISGPTLYRADYVEQHAPDLYEDIVSDKTTPHAAYNQTRERQRDANTPDEAQAETSSDNQRSYSRVEKHLREAYDSLYRAQPLVKDTHWTKDESKRISAMLKHIKSLATDIAKGD